MHKIGLLLFLFLGVGASAQDTIRVASIDTASTTIESDTAVLTFCEVMPQFNGGNDAFAAYLQENIIYPQAEKRAGKQGTVYVSFVVEKDGSISNVLLKKGVSNAPGLGEEAVRVLSEMPAWTPASMNSGAVRCIMTVPIKFVLTGKSKKRNSRNKK